MNAKEKKGKIYKPVLFTVGALLLVEIIFGVFFTEDFGNLIDVYKRQACVRTLFSCCFHNSRAAKGVPCMISCIFCSLSCLAERRAQAHEIRKNST